MFLVTTADQQFWKTDERLLFLGEWCKLYEARKLWRNLDHEVLPYQWDDRNALYKAYLYVGRVYEDVLAQLADRLSELHGERQPLRYWRIVVGQWLHFFVEVLYDRYVSICAAADSGKVTNTWVANYPEETWVPHDCAAFQEWCISNDAYNHHVYGDIIRLIGRIPREAITPPPVPVEREPPRPRKVLVRKVLKRLLAVYPRHLPARWNRVALVDTAFHPWDQVALQMAIGQVPYLFTPEIRVAPKDLDKEQRGSLGVEIGAGEFERILSEVIQWQIPKAYVEGYAQLLGKAERAFPRSPKVIVTATAYSVNEGFKMWAARQVARGTRLIVLQHGGHYGSGLWSGTEDHELRISDRYYTWGWRTSSETSAVPQPVPKLRRTQRLIRPKVDGEILWVADSLPRYSYRMYSVPAGPQFLRYLEEQERFYRAVSAAVRKRLFLRLYPLERGWNERKRWEHLAPELKVSQGKGRLVEQLNQSRLVIATSNTTTFLETLSANFPTIAFWNPAYWEIRPEATAYYEELSRVGILHKTPESAATAVNAVWANVQTWWMQEEIQRSRGSFCEAYARTSDRWREKWRDALRDEERRAECTMN